MRETRLLNITVPVFNRPETTERTIEGIRSTRSPVPYHLHVVDNGSEPETMLLLRRMKQRGMIDTLLRSERNLGVSFAANLGWSRRAGDLYMKVDNDISMHDPDWLRGMLACWREVSPVSNIAVSWIRELYEAGERISTSAGELSLCPTNLAGGTILIPKAVSDALGFWSEDYGLYGGADGDYGMRMRVAGFPQYYYSGEGLLSHGGAEDDVRKDYLQRGIDKAKLIKNIFPETDTDWGLFPLNSLLFTLRVRSVRVPLKYVFLGMKDDYTVNVGISRDYLRFRKGLLLCRELLREMFPDEGASAMVSQSAVAHMRSIMERHGDNALV